MQVYREQTLHEIRDGTRWSDRKKKLELQHCGRGISCWSDDDDLRLLLNYNLNMNIHADL